MSNKIMTVCVNDDLLKSLASTRWVNRVVGLISRGEVAPTALVIGLGAWRDLDLVRIADGAVVDEAVVFRTHTFENWELQFGQVTIGEDVAVGTNSELMPGCVL